MEDHFCLKDGLTDYGIQTWVFGKCVLGIEQSEPVTQAKQLRIFVVTDKIPAFKQKLEFCKTCICHGELDSFSIFKESYDEIGSAVNVSDILNILHKMCQHLEALYNSVDQIFQKVNAGYYKIMHNERFIQSARRTNKFSNSRLQKVNWCLQILLYN